MTVSIILRILVPMGIALVPGVASEQESWPDFRGPERSGVIASRPIPSTWSESENVRWKAEIHGEGWSTPIIAGGVAWLTTSENEGLEKYAVAVDMESGDILIDRKLVQLEEEPLKHPLNSHASPSCVLGQSAVYVHFGTHGTFALDRESGETLWHRDDIHCEHSVGPGSSPILYDDSLLIFHMDGIDTQYVIALDASSGETFWKVNRSVDFSALDEEARKAYGTPIVIQVDGEDQIVCLGPEGTMAYEPSSGDEIWRVRYTGYSMAARPLFEDGVLYLCTGFNNPSIMAVKADGKGDVTESHILWTLRRNVPTMPSPVLVSGLLFMISDGGIASCLDPKSGDVHWRERLDGEFSSSLLAVGDSVYFFDRLGKTTIIRASETFEKMGENSLESGFMASPAVVGDALVLRTKTHLYKIEDSSR